MTALSRVRARPADKMPHRRLVLSRRHSPRFASANLRDLPSQRPGTKTDRPPGTGATTNLAPARIAASRMGHVNRLHAMSRKCLAKTATISLKNDVQTDAYGWRETPFSLALATISFPRAFPRLASNCLPLPNPPSFICSSYVLLLRSNVSRMEAWQHGCSH